MLHSSLAGVLWTQILDCKRRSLEPSQNPPFCMYIPARRVHKTCPLFTILWHILCRIRIKYEYEEYNKAPILRIFRKFGVLYLAEKEGFENSVVFQFPPFLRYVFNHVSTFVSTFCFFIMSANLFDIVSDTSFFLAS